MVIYLCYIYNLHGDMHRAEEIHIYIMYIHLDIRVYGYFFEENRARISIASMDTSMDIQNSHDVKF